jgi:dienelactone hydrolase
VLLRLLIVLAAAFPALATASPSVAAVVPASWAAASTVQVSSHDIEFQSGAVKLSGTLYAPAGRRALAAVVVLHGASSPLRDLPLYAHLRTALPALGMAVFVYDRRASGKSVPTTGSHDFDLLSDDGVAAADMLRRQPEIDPKRVGYWGLSQGGWLTLMCAGKDPKAAFAVSVSAPIVPPDIQMNYAVANILRVDGYSQADIHEAVEMRRAIDGYLKGTLDKASAERPLAAARDKPWFKLTYTDRELDDPATSSWLKQMRLDPIKTLERVKVPTLMIYGADDPWVPVGVSVQTLKARAADFPAMELRVIPHADHTMMVGVDPKAQMDPAAFAAEAPDSPEYFMTLAAWLTERGFARADGRL